MSWNLIKLITIIAIIFIVASNKKYYTWLNKAYKMINQLPKVATIVFAIITILGIKIYNPFPQLKIDEILDQPTDSSKNDSDLVKFADKQKVKRNVSDATKKIVAARQQWRCKICGRVLDETYEVDHIIPLYKGGTNDIDNLMALDPICHRKKTNADRLGISIETYLKLFPR